MKAVAPINPHILEEAADWLMQLHTSSVTEADRAACAQWRQADPEHARAWARAELLMNKLGGLPVSLAMPALDRPVDTERRAAIAKLAMLLAIVPAGIAAWRVAEWQEWTVDYRTATGERRDVQLADGTRITLNTASAINVVFDVNQRLVVLREGEILVRTAPDNAGSHRPFRVATEQGRLEALGTYFSVRQQTDRTHLAVFEGAVHIEPRKLPASTHQHILHAGQQSFFTARGIDPIKTADESGIAWTRGMLMADKLRLGEFVAELARYRSGFLRCDPAVADIRVSGAYPIANTDQALAMLASTYPVEIGARLGGYWVAIVPQQK